MKSIISVFKTIICSKNFDFGRILVLNKSFKVFKHRENFILVFQQEESCKSSTIINKDNVEIETKNRSEKGRTLNITMNNV